MTERQVNRIALTYLLIGILTYGVAFNRTKRPDESLITDMEAKGFIGMVSAIAWPLYWSVQLFKFTAPDGKERGE